MEGLQLKLTKKIIALFLIAALAVSLIACSANENTQSNSSESSVSEKVDDENKESEDKEESEESEVSNEDNDENSLVSDNAEESIDTNDGFMYDEGYLLSAWDNDDEQASLQFYSDYTFDLSTAVNLGFGTWEYMREENKIVLYYDGQTLYGSIDSQGNLEFDFADGVFYDVYAPFYIREVDSEQIVGIWDNHTAWMSLTLNHDFSFSISSSERTTYGTYVFDGDTGALTLNVSEGGTDYGNYYLEDDSIVLDSLADFGAFYPTDEATYVPEY